MFTIITSVDTGSDTVILSEVGSSGRLNEEIHAIDYHHCSFYYHRRCNQLPSPYRIFPSHKCRRGRGKNFYPRQPDPLLSRRRPSRLIRSLSSCPRPCPKSTCIHPEASSCLHSICVFWHVAWKMFMPVAECLPLFVGHEEGPRVSPATSKHWTIVHRKGVSLSISADMSLLQL